MSTLINMNLQSVHVFGFSVLLAAGASLSEEVKIPEKLCTAEWVFASDQWGKDGSMEGGLRIRLAPGWHTYALDPGEVGAPPVIALKTPKGIRVSKPQFPPHKEFADPAGVSYGYEKELLIRYVFEKQEPGRTPPLEIELELLLCREVCVPFFERIKIPWPTGETMGKSDDEADRWRDLLRRGGWEPPPSNNKAELSDKESLKDPSAKTTKQEEMKK